MTTLAAAFGAPSLAPPRRHFLRLLSLPNLLTLAFVLACGVITFAHPLWRDEAQAFLIGRDSHSVGELLYNLRYEGHPPLWHFLLFVLTRFTVRPEAMQALHLAMAGSSVYLVARFAPFAWPVKVLFAFGYFPFFEYAVFARNYQLFMLLTFALCALWQHRRHSFVVTGLLLAMLCLTHAFGDILAGALGAMLLLDSLVTASGRLAIRRHPGRFAMGILIALIAAGVSVKLLIPPHDSGYKPGWHLEWEPARVQRTLADLWSAYVPVPERVENFWDTHALLDEPARQAKWGLLLALGALGCMMRSWRAALFFLIATIGALGFFYIKLNSGATRHHGVLFVALIAGLWIAWTPRNSSGASDLGPRRRVVRRWFHALAQIALAALLLVHVYGAAIACNMCWTYVFTPSRQAAAIVRAAVRPGDVLVSGNQIITAPIAAYLPGQRFYFPHGERWGTFTLWDQTSWRDATSEEILNFTRRQTRPVIVIRCWDDGPLPRAKLLGHFDSGVEQNEMYTIYRLEPRRR